MMRANGLIPCKNVRIKACWFIGTGMSGDLRPTVRSIVDGKWSRDQDESLPLLDLGNRMVIPGFVDMHTHVTRYPEVLLDLFRWGITVIREVGSTWKAIENVRRRDIKPFCFTSGPLIDGDPPRWPHISLSVKNQEDVQQIIREHIRFGVEWVKAYYRLSPDLLQILIKESHSKGLRVAGHLGLTLRWEEAVNMGIDTLEHIRLGVVDRLLPARLSQKIARAPWPWKDVLFWEALNLQHPRLARLFNRMSQKGTVWIPTFEVLATKFRRHPRKGVNLAEWHRLRWQNKRDYAVLNEKQKRRGRRIFRKILRFARMARDLGVRMMVGTDTPNVGIEPGRSFHDELKFFEKAGFPIDDILEMATFSPRSYLGMPEWGHEGEPADFIILGTRRLESVRDLRKLLAVYHGGGWVFLHPRLIRHGLLNPVNA